MHDSKEVITDRFGRRFEKLRVSLINECNFSCTYCVLDEPSDQSSFKDPVAKSSGQPRLKTDEFIRAVGMAHELLGLKSIRLTGGEPLLYPELEKIIRGIQSIGINDIRLTTNAYYLRTKAQRFKDAGLKAINVSLDAVDQEVFHQLSGNPRLERVQDGIDAALDAG
ncbi:MAG TPA: radical SAM protein, partial [Sunxiuqinia sp.]|nr:radical SAM protein [Sunxiuqinia sp.]